MKQIDLELTPPVFQLDPAATASLAAYTAKLQDILRQIIDHAGTIEVVSSAPAVLELEERGDGKGSILSEVKVLDSGTQTNRRLYYRFQGNLRFIESD